MVALAGARRRLHFAQQRVHFLRRQAASGAHGTMAGAGRQHMVETTRQRARVAVFGEQVGDVGDEFSPRRSRLKSPAFPAPEPRPLRTARSRGQARRVRSRPAPARRGARRPIRQRPGSAEFAGRLRWPRAGASTSHRQDVHARRVDRRSPIPRGSARRYRSREAAPAPRRGARPGLAARWRRSARSCRRRADRG